MIAFYGQNFKIANAFVAVAVAAGLGLLADLALRHLETRVEEWRHAAQPS